MKFTPKQNKKARLLGQALSRSLDIDTATANDAVAQMYGHSRWDTLCKAIQKSPASMWDEEVSSEVVQAREEIQIERLSQCLQLDHYATRMLVQHLRPTSKAKSQPYRVDRSRPGPSDLPASDFSAITEAFEVGANQQGSAVMAGLLQQALTGAGEDSVDGLDSGNLEDRMRIARPIDPGAFFDILQGLGWPLDESSFEQRYVYGEPSFFAESQIGHVPVYLTSLAMTPDDSDDRMANEVMDLIEEDNYKNMQTERFILMWGQPQVRVVDGHCYSYWGRLWQQGQWRDFLINGDMTSADRLFDMNPLGQSINRPNKAQSDPQHELAKGVVIFMQGLQQQRERVKMAAIKTASGWDMLVPSLQAAH